MKIFKVEYQDRKRVKSVIGYAYLISLALIIVLILLNQFIGQSTLAILIISLAYLPLSVLIILPGKFTSLGEVRIGQDKVVFELSTETITVNFRDISEYSINEIGGITLKIWTRDYDKLKIFANEQHMDASHLGKACKFLENTINEYNFSKEEKITTDKPKPVAPINHDIATPKYVRKSDDLKIIRKKTFIEKKYAVYFIAAFVIFATLATIHSIIEKGRITGPILTGWASLIAILAAYQSKRKTHSNNE